MIITDYIRRGEKKREDSQMELPLPLTQCKMRKVFLLQSVQLKILYKIPQISNSQANFTTEISYNFPKITESITEFFSWISPTTLFEQDI